MTKTIVFIRCCLLLPLALLWRGVKELGYDWIALRLWVQLKVEAIEKWERQQNALDRLKRL